MKHKKHMHIHEKARVPVLRRALETLLPARQVHIEEDIHESEEDVERDDVGWRGAMGLAGILSAGGLYALWLYINQPKMEKQGEPITPVGPAIVVHGGVPPATPPPKTPTPYPNHDIPADAPDYLKAYLQLFATQNPEWKWEALKDGDIEPKTNEIDAMTQTVLSNTEKYKDVGNGKNCENVVNARIVMNKINAMRTEVKIEDFVFTMNRPRHLFYDPSKDYASYDTTKAVSVVIAKNKIIPWRIICSAALLFYLDVALTLTLNDTKCTKENLRSNLMKIETI